MMLHSEQRRSIDSNKKQVNKDSNMILKDSTWKASGTVSMLAVGGVSRLTNRWWCAHIQPWEKDWHQQRNPKHLPVDWLFWLWRSIWNETVTMINSTWTSNRKKKNYFQQLTSEPILLTFINTDEPSWQQQVLARSLKISFMLTLSDSSFSPFI